MHKERVINQMQTTTGNILYDINLNRLNCWFLDNRKAQLILVPLILFIHLAVKNFNRQPQGFQKVLTLQLVNSC